MASKKPASKKKVKIADLPKPAEELTPARARGVRGGLRRGYVDPETKTEYAKDKSTEPMEDLEIQR